jgi:hypothetical protein
MSYETHFDGQQGDSTMLKSKYLIALALLNSFPALADDGVDADGDWIGQISFVKSNLQPAPRPGIGVSTTRVYRIDAPNGFSDLVMEMSVKSSDIYYCYPNWIWYECTSFYNDDFLFVPGNQQFIYETSYFQALRFSIEYAPSETDARLAITLFVAPGGDTHSRPSGCNDPTYSPQYPCAVHFSSAKINIGGLFPEEQYTVTLLRETSFNVVPEPATWAMMIAGFGLVGGGLRMRRRRDAQNVGAPQLAG